MTATMKPIQMVDLVGQYEKPGIADCAITRRGPISRVHQWPGGQDFEQELAAAWGEARDGCANGTDALEAAAVTLDLQPGDEVITPSFTFVACVEVVALPV